MGHPFLLYTKRTGLEPATSAVTGLRSNQTELPLLAFVAPSLRRVRANYIGDVLRKQDFFSKMAKKIGKSFLTDFSGLTW